ncbi:hypothetical protein XPA_010500 [Xanthoria parietina]
MQRDRGPEERSSTYRYSRFENNGYLPSRSYAPSPAVPVQPRHPSRQGPALEGRTRNVSPRKPLVTPSNERVTREGSKATVRARGRHVSFQIKPMSMHLSPGRTPSRRPRGGSIPDVTALDHIIAGHGGTTSTIDDLPHRLRISKNKQRPTPTQRIEELTREIGYLRQELAYYKDTRRALTKFFAVARSAHEALRRGLGEASQELAIAEQAMLAYWNIHPSDGNAEDAVF